MNEIVAKELKVLRVRKDLTLEKVAEDLGTNRETIRRYEKGETEITIEKLERLLNYYETDKRIFFENVCANMQQKQEGMKWKQKKKF